MKNIYFKSILIPFLLFSINIVWSQVGIGSSSPKGALDIGATNAGLVYPIVALSDVNTETISNPNGANIVTGTLVYNSNTSSNGVNSVYPGLYFWNGTKWIPQFGKKDNKLHYQNGNLRTQSNITGGDQSISFDESSFNPKYSGVYKILVTVHYGGGELDNPSNPQYVNFNSEEGVFKFSFNETTTTFKLKSFSGKNNDRLFKGGSGSPQKVYTNQYNQTSVTIEETLVAEMPYPFTLTFNQETAPGFINDGNGSASAGRGYIFINDNLKCTVEFNYVGE